MNILQFRTFRIDLRSLDSAGHAVNPLVQDFKNPSLTQLGHMTL